MIFKNRRGEDSGPLQKMFIAIVLMALFSTAILGFITGITNNYAVDTSDLDYSVYNESLTSFSSAESSVSDINNRLANASGGEIITVMLTGGFGVLLDLLSSIPTFFTGLIQVGLNSVGLGQYAVYATTLLLVIILFSIIAIIMKVRA